MSDTRNSTALALSVLGVAVGLCLLALPWIPEPPVNPLPAHFTASDPAFAKVRMLMKRVDAAIETADVDAFRRATTPAFVAALERSLLALDRRLNRAALQDWAAQRPPGEFATLAQGTLRVGTAVGARACAVFEGGPAAGSSGRLVGFVLEASGGVLRLDAVRSLQARSATTAEQLAADLLGTAGP